MSIELDVVDASLTFDLAEMMRNQPQMPATENDAVLTDWATAAARWRERYDALRTLLGDRLIQKVLDELEEEEQRRLRELRDQLKGDL